MKRIAALLALNLLLSGASYSCFANMGIVHVSREDAKELGIEIRSKGNAPNEVWVELELKVKDLVYEVHEGGWQELESHRQYFNSPSFYSGLREFLLVCDTCVSVLAVESPEIIDLGADPEQPVED
jgi:hypothetical protein